MTSYDQKSPPSLVYELFSKLCHPHAFFTWVFVTPLLLWEFIHDNPKAMLGGETGQSRASFFAILLRGSFLFFEGFWLKKKPFRDYLIERIFLGIICMRRRWIKLV